MAVFGVEKNSGYTVMSNDCLHNQGLSQKTSVGFTHIILEKIRIFVYNVLTRKESARKVNSPYGKLPTNGVYQSAASISMWHRDASPVQSGSGVHGRSPMMP